MQLSLYYKSEWHFKQTEKKLSTNVTRWHRKINYANLWKLDLKKWAFNFKWINCIQIDF